MMASLKLSVVPLAIGCVSLALTYLSFKWYQNHIRLSIQPTTISSPTKNWTNFPYTSLVDKTRIGYPGQIERIADWKVVMHPKSKKLITVFLVYWKYGVDHMGNIKLASWMDIDMLNDAVHKSQSCQFFDGIDTIEWKEPDLANEDKDPISIIPTTIKEEELTETIPNQQRKNDTPLNSSEDSKDRLKKREVLSFSRMTPSSIHKAKSLKMAQSELRQDSDSNEDRFNNKDNPTDVNEYTLHLEDSKLVQIQKLEAKVEDLKKKLERRDVKYQKLKDEQEELFVALGERNLKLKSLKTKFGMPLTDDEEE